MALKEELAAAAARAKAATGLPRTGDGRVDYSADFFGRAAYLTVSGQLQAECCATALTDVYTFGELALSPGKHCRASRFL
jgi:hypothetical protein